MLLLNTEPDFSTYISLFIKKKKKSLFSQKSKFKIPAIMCQLAVISCLLERCLGCTNSSLGASKTIPRASLETEHNVVY